MTLLGVLNSIWILGIFVLWAWLSLRYIRFGRNAFVPLHPLHTAFFWVDVLHLLFGAFCWLVLLCPLAWSNTLFEARDFLVALGGVAAPWIWGYSTLVDPNLTFLGKVVSLFLIACFLIPWHRLWVAVLCFRRHLSDEQQGFALFSIFFFYWPEMLVAFLLSAYVRGT